MVRLVCSTSYFPLYSSSPLNSFALLYGLNDTTTLFATLSVPISWLLPSHTIVLATPSLYSPFRSYRYTLPARWTIRIASGCKMPSSTSYNVEASPSSSTKFSLRTDKPPLVMLLPSLNLVDTRLVSIPPYWMPARVIAYCTISRSVRMPCKSYLILSSMPKSLNVRLTS